MVATVSAATHCDSVNTCNSYQIAFIVLTVMYVLVIKQQMHVGRGWIQLQRNTSRSVRDSQNVCRGASAIHCNWQFFRQAVSVGYAKQYGRSTMYVFIWDLLCCIVRHCSPNFYLEWIYSYLN